MVYPSHKTFVKCGISIVTDDIIVNMDGGVGGSWKVNKITPETYEKMNEEFEEEGLAFRIIVPTQEQIDEWRSKE
ncbi:hypothetical protein SSM2_268 [Synechococcus phage S-SM2]|uniref:Uncharacterized protein n=1 Tax=Synechococcus phage S-SM2 TaxID=444860 RepID=E3SJF3_9CAUD|nr:hypothetical protein SSM2_268 [Synechococcus phage S-SM2]ADO97601.1 hypothetical protein SSM2_268 [Synechococcus phage S-SM2]